LERIGAGQLTPVPGVAAELGYAHKVRSPNLYERYSWGRGTMSTSMIGWYGDGNGYVGNVDLRPERADTVSLAITASGGGKGAGSSRPRLITPMWMIISTRVC
jgi:iron complex outermembrane receptor protein